MKAKVNGKTKTLTKGTDYSVSYKNNVNVGTATVIVKGKGAYTGTIKKTFKITAVPLASATLKKSSMTYTGTKRTQTSGIVVKAKVNGTTKTLTKSTDYTVSYTDNINVGTATVTIKGKGNYKGTIKKTFKITAVKLASAEIKHESMVYTGKARTQTNSTIVKAKVNGELVTLIKNTDYKITYADNVEVGTATMTIKGVGNFKGTIKKTFTIYKESTVVDPVSGWSAYDDLISRSRTETDKAARTSLLHQAEDMLMSTYAVLPLYYYNDIYMVKDYVSGIYANVYGTKYFMYGQKNGGSDPLNLYLASEPYTLDPALNSSVDGASMILNSFSGLYTYDAGGKTVPACAQGYEVSADGCTYTVTLKEGLKWSDGSDLTAADFEYSWKRAADPATGADYGYLFEIMEGYGTDAGINVSAADDRTLTFVLAAPCAYMEDLMAFPTFCPVKQSAVEADPENWCKDAGFVSNGAFKCTDWEHDNVIIYEKNEYFYDADNVVTEGLTYLLSGSEEKIYAAYESNDLDFSDIASEEMIESGSSEVVSKNELGTYYIAFNVKSSVFDGMTAEQAAGVREAVNMLIDRTNIVSGGLMPASTFVPVGMADGNGGIFHEDNQHGYYDAYAVSKDHDGTLSKARKLLEAAGFKFDDSGKLSQETPLSFNYVTNENSAHLRIADLIQADLSAVGISLTIKVVEWNAFQPICQQGDFDIARGGWIADFNDPINMLEMFISDSGNNYPQFGK